MISAADMLRVSPAWPVAQNGQFIPQPACDETHSVIRPGYRISTDSTSAPSCSFHRNLIVSPLSVSSRRTSVSSGRQHPVDEILATLGGQVASSPPDRASSA